ncbi:tetratricopeptide repeat protein [Waterburya agarophytonicola K14]|uniref:Tetratricopeptide repeat protein n=1 Tax=Waterburya agarophytonicola KI4 TaxID=2874699 RepID=A0A964BU68_9CYAN|nr:tetratricopeptide repeat protein [Waterburya agarophytonicola]MCC0178941.1 tetratricopeptide repeat protein [Waterburya agarophytonicola KI4]
MSHTIGQVTENNQQSNASQDSPPLEDKTSESVSLLSDADYEFLFNQLLEGVSHGWHDRRIIKFFAQLGDRGKQEDWIAWLERLRTKIITLPIQSKRQLGTIMVRLGELTQSAAQVKEIGSASNRIGRELLFGNTEDVVWEYVGPDLILDSPSMNLETEETLSERLPQDFAELGSAAMKDGGTDLSSNVTSKEEPSLEESIDATETIAESPNDLSSETEPEDEFPFTELLEEVPDDDFIPKESTEKEIPDSNYSQSPSTYSEEEFEFELDEVKSEAMTEEFIQDSSPIKLETEELSPDPVAIDMDRVMNLIQQDEELAQKISQKLNVPLTKLDNPVAESPSDSSLTPPVDLDRSSIDLIEGWFNLGLKQVSGGEFDKAIASWEKALSINPNLSEAWHNRGSALGRLGKYEEAVESFQKALSIDPNNYQAWNDRAHALYQLENWLAAADSWRNAIKITPGNHLFWYNRGCALEQLENWAESIASYEKSLEIKPDFQPARSRYTNLVADNSRSN